MAKTYRVRRLRYRQQNPSGTNIAGMLLLGVGGYLLYKWMTGSAGATAIPVTQSTGNTVTVSAPPPTQAGNVASTPPMISSSDILAAITMAYQSNNANFVADQNTTQTLDEWAWAMQNVAGKPFSISSDLMDKIVGAAGGNRNQLITLSHWLQLYNAAANAHISGLGLGRVYVSGFGDVDPSPFWQNYFAHHPGITDFVQRHPLFGAGFVQHPAWGGMILRNLARDAWLQQHPGVGQDLRTIASNYLSRIGVPGMSGLGMIGGGYNINAQRGGDASYYELATKYVM